MPGGFFVLRMNQNVKTCWKHAYGNENIYYSPSHTKQNNNNKKKTTKNFKFIKMFFPNIFEPWLYYFWAKSGHHDWPR